MSEISDKIQEKCLAFGDRVIKLNDFLLEEEGKKEEERVKKSKGCRVRWLKPQTSDLVLQTSTLGTLLEHLHELNVHFRGVEEHI